MVAVPKAAKVSKVVCSRSVEMSSNPVPKTTKKYMSKLTFSQKKLIAFLAYEIKCTDERKAWLSRVLPKEFPLYARDPLEKIRYWRKEIKERGHQCSYGDGVDDFVAYDINHILIDNEEAIEDGRCEDVQVLNLDVVLAILHHRRLQFDSKYRATHSNPNSRNVRGEDSREESRYGKLLGLSWATAFVKRHDLPPSVISVVGTRFSKKWLTDGRFVT